MKTLKPQSSRPEEALAELQKLSRLLNLLYQQDRELILILLEVEKSPSTSTSSKVLQNAFVPVFEELLLLFTDHLSVLTAYLAKRKETASLCKS